MRRWTQFLSMLFSFLLLMLCVSGCGKPLASQPSSSGETPRVFRMNLGTEPPDLDPAKVTDLTSFTVLQNIMRGLTTFGDDGKVVPAIAASWEIRNNGRKIIFHLRPDALWSDGQPVKASDFLFAWRRALDPRRAAPYAFFLFDIEGAEAYFRGKSVPLGIRVLDERTLEVSLRRSIPFFLDLMASPVALPLRLENIDRHTGDAFSEEAHWIVNGPFQIKAWRHDELLSLQPNARYYGFSQKKPALDRIDMLMIGDSNTSVVMYENNDLDYIETTSSIPSFDVRRLRKLPEARIQTLHRIDYLGFNTQKPPFNDVNVRRAFAMSLDRTYYPRLLQSGQKPIASWISPGMPGYNPRIGIVYQPQKAKTIIQNWLQTHSEKPGLISLGYQTGYDIQKQVEIAQFLWKRNLNLPVHLENMEWKVYLRRLSDDPPSIFRLGWYVDYPDPDSYLSLFTSGNGNNYTGWHHPDYDRWVKEAAVTLNPQKRQLLMDKAQRLLLEKDVVIVPLFVSEKTYLVKPWVHGLSVNAMNLIQLERLQVDPHV